MTSRTIKAEMVVGRQEEKADLKLVAASKEAELVAVYGRRRVGKTFLIRNVFHKELAFEFTGMHNASLDQQLKSFTSLLSASIGGLPLAKPSDWLDAFSMLETYLLPLLQKERRAVFFDEFPWINTPRSGFLPAFENFWNTWASRQPNLIVIICGSAATWIIQNVINNRGGLHNRVTRRIQLLPFTIGETEAFLKSRHIKLNRYQILQLYMTMGGIPQYLQEIKVGESAIQAIDRLCFTKNGLLRNEYKNLYASLFDNAGRHMEIIRALAGKSTGLTRSEVITSCNLSSGGTASQLLEELEESGFITLYLPFGKTAKDGLYKLTDEYSLFYIKFVENKRSQRSGNWSRLSAGTAWKSWCGFAFENVCMKHVPQLQAALGIKNVYTETSVWRSPGKKTEKGAQIDLLIDRQDRCINICEMKFSIDPFEITKSYAEELRNKAAVFRTRTQTRKTLFLTMVTTYGVKNIDGYTGLIQNELTMDALFD